MQESLLFAFEFFTVQLNWMSVLLLKKPLDYNTVFAINKQFLKILQSLSTTK